MKKNVKTILLASAAALAFGGIAVGTTFALFTSKAETNVTVQSGTVKVEQTSEITSVFELNDTPVSASEGVYTNSIGGKAYIDSANINVLHLEKWAPGDKAVIEFTNINKSNIAIKSRFTYNHTSTSEYDLFEKLDFVVEAYDAEDNPIQHPEYWDTYAAAEDTTAGYLMSKVVVTITFVDGDNGEIKYDPYNNDNQYQDSNCTIYFSLEAVQGNADVGE